MVGLFVRNCLNSPLILEPLEPLASIPAPVILRERSDKNLKKYEMLRYFQHDNLSFSRAPDFSPFLGEAGG
jgi:hypothetical protein